MANAKETCAQIFAEMRGNEFDDPHLNGAGIIGARRLARDWADRLEAAIQREREESGDAQKMREAMSSLLDMLKELRQKHFNELSNDDRMILGKMSYETIEALLKAWPRNCEVGTADERAQRFETFCSLHHYPKGKGCYSCPAIPPKSPLAFHRDACRIKWAWMPYESEAAK